MSNIGNNMQTQTSNTLHNAIMEAGSKNRPPMLAPGNYIQWKSRIKRYIDTKPNQELIHYCLENPPYELGWKEKAILDSEGNPITATERVFETYKNVKQEIRDQLNAKAEAVTSERAVRFLALEVVAGCLPLEEVNNLVHTAAVGGGVTVVSKLLFVFQILALVFGRVAPFATA
nr:hypothetical protein [Tanacetum cinerariifolium]